MAWLLCEVVLVPGTLIAFAALLAILFHARAFVQMRQKSKCCGRGDLDAVLVITSAHFLDKRLTPMGRQQVPGNGEMRSRRRHTS